MFICMKKVLAKKLNMAQVFEDDGRVVPITWLKVEDSSIFKDIKTVFVTGTSKGRGFAGVVKRWGFAGGPKTHGQSDRHRAPGSIGATTGVARVLKGKKMPGRFGGKTVTLKNKEIKIVEDKKIAVSGPVPGSYNSKVVVKFEENKNEG